MDTLICPYCDSEVKISMVEAEEGCCPECGSSISATAAYNSYHDDDYEDNELEDDDDHGYNSKSNNFDEELDEDLDEEEYGDMDDEDDNYV